MLMNAQKLRNLQNLLESHGTPKEPAKPILKPKSLLDPKILESFHSDLDKNLQNLRKKFDKQLMASGGVDSGGGNLLVLNSGEVRLLDHYVHGFASRSTYDHSLVLPMTKSLKAWGIDKFNLDTWKIRDVLLRKINAWASSSPFMVGLLVRAVQNMPIYITTHEIAIQDRQYLIPTSVDKKKIGRVVTSALYIHDFGVFISKKWFESLSYEDQIGLLMHESIRHIQLTLGYQNSNQSLQKLTVALMRGPSAGASLDTQEFIDGKLIVQLLEKAEFESYKLLVITKSCAVYTSYLNKPCPLNGTSKQDMEPLEKELFSYYLNRSNSEESRKIVQAAHRSIGILIDLMIQKEIGNILDGLEDTLIPIKNIGSGNFIDSACDDFNENSFFWSPFKDNAKKILAQLHRASSAIRT